MISCWAVLKELKLNKMIWLFKNFKDAGIGEFCFYKRIDPSLLKLNEYTQNCILITDLEQMSISNTISRWKTDIHIPSTLYSSSLSKNLQQSITGNFTERQSVIQISAVIHFLECWVYKKVIIPLLTYKAIVQERVNGLQCASW